MRTSLPQADFGTAAASIGPNAITQMRAALLDVVGPAETVILFRRAALQRYLAALPEQLVPEIEVVRLHGAVRNGLVPAMARRVSTRAGSATAKYLLEHRIPRLAHVILRASPRGVATRLLCAAIQRHSWTFAGSAEFTVDVRTRPTFILRNCPLCREQTAGQPLCGYYAATFQGLFQQLVDARARVEETHCAAVTGCECRFELSFPPG